MPPPIGRARSTAATLLIFAAAFVLLLALMDLRITLYDEGIILSGGMHVAGGAVPHRDFYANYGPAQFYIVAALFKLFGPSFLAARIWDVVLRAAIVALAWHMLSARVRPFAALAAAAVCGLWMAGMGYSLYPMYPTLLFALAGTALLLPRDGGEPGPGRLAAAGACTGLVALFRYDVGFFVFAAHAGALVIILLAFERQARFIRLARSLLHYAAGTALIFLPPALLLLRAGALPGFLHDILEYPVHYYPAMRRLPLPGLAALLAKPPEAADYLPFLVPLVAGAAFLRPRWRAQIPAGDRAFVVTLAVLALVLSVKGMVRFQAIHLLLAIVPATLLVAYLADRGRGWIRAAAAGGALIAAAAPLYQAASFASTAARAPRLTFAGALLGRPAPRGLAPVPGNEPALTDANTACAVQYLRERTRPGDRIFSANGRHDRIVLNNNAFYFAAGRRAGSHWYHFDPGLQTRADVQAVMVRELEGAGVGWVVRTSSWDRVAEPNASAISSGVTLLDRYLDSRFSPVERFGPVSVWRRKGPAGPPQPPFRCAVRRP